MRRILTCLFDRYMLVRDIRAGTLLEDFLISAVSAVLVIRLSLHLAGYPQVSTEHLHFAHVLLGGLLMLAAVIIMLTFINRSARELAAILGGVGYGAFIDELGKFITADNDYFFQPAVALIYVTFVLLFLLFRAMGNLREPAQQRECLASGLEMAKEAVFHGGLSARDQEYALNVLDQCDQENRLVQSLRNIIQQTRKIPPERPNMMSRLMNYLQELSQRLIEKPWFTLIVIAFFVLKSVFTMLEMVIVVERSWALRLWLAGGAVVIVAEFLSARIRNRYLQILPSMGLVVIAILTTWALLVNLGKNDMTFIDYGRLIFPTISGVLVLIGISLIHRNRLRAYYMFYRAVLVSILLTQGLAFYEDQFLALSGLFLDIIILLTLRYVISQEEVIHREGIA